MLYLRLQSCLGQSQFPRNHTDTPATVVHQPHRLGMYSAENVRRLPRRVATSSTPIAFSCFSGHPRTRGKSALRSCLPTKNIACCNNQLGHLDSGNLREDPSLFADFHGSSKDVQGAKTTARPRDDYHLSMGPLRGSIPSKAPSYYELSGNPLSVSVAARGRFIRLVKFSVKPRATFYAIVPMVIDVRA
jgi:hypothetical protein